jgi:uncharacterized membrane protein YfcA
MTTSLLLVIYTAFGFIGHLTRRYTTAHMENMSWRDLCNYGLGVIYVFPLAAFLFGHLERDIPRPMLRFTVSFWFAFVSFGLGVVAGHRYQR